MAGLKEIKRRLRSVRNTKKITYAMKLVSAAKLRRAQESVMRAREYTSALRQLLARSLAEAATLDISHPLLRECAEPKRLLLLVIGGNRGLAGGYNSNLHKRIESFMREKKAATPEVSVDTLLLGRKPAEYYRRIRRTYVEAHETLAENPNLWPIEDICAAVEEKFIGKSYDEVYLLFTQFRSALSVTPTIERMLPLDADKLLGTRSSESVTGSTIFEPSLHAVFAAILPRLVRSQLRQAALDAKASELGCRMTAMDSATKNAGELIGALQLKYNKVRQSRITAELLDIIGGANALE
jgi:F-type H+-transporting ATPase subunit gamma